MPATEPGLGAFLTVEGPQMIFSAVRSPLASAGEGHFTTLSAEAVEALVAQMQAWALSRVLRMTSQIDELPAAMRVRVRLSGAEDNTLEPELDILWHRTGPGQPEAHGVEPYGGEALHVLRNRMHRWVLMQLVDPARARMPQELKVSVDVQPA
ncbi:hypothetical protein [Flindersiella endophytica]